MPISRRLLITSTLAFLLVGAIALLCLIAASVWLSQRTQTYASLVEVQQNVRTRALSLREGLLAAESSQRGFLVTGNEIYLAPFETAKISAGTELRALADSLANQQQFARMLPRLKMLVEQRLRELDTLVKLTLAGQRSGAVELLGTNEGKAAMDEIQVFLSAVVVEAEDQLKIGLAEQTGNITALRLGTMLASLMVLVVVAGVVITFARYTREIAEARDELATANSTLEARVEKRTADLVIARDRAEVLLAEVNHRVANSLSFVGALVNLQRQSIGDPAAKAALSETRGRIQAVADMHKHLYTTGDVTSVQLDGYLGDMLERLAEALGSDGAKAPITVDLEPVRVPTNVGVNLGIVVTEWVTNAVKYAYGGALGAVRVIARAEAEALHLVVEDDGVGLSPNGKAQGTGMGSKIVATVARSLKAEVVYASRHPGTEARLVMPLAAS
jgi:two-component sensor histidine kinase